MKLSFKTLLLLGSLFATSAEAANTTLPNLVSAAYMSNYVGSFFYVTNYSGIVTNQDTNTLTVSGAGTSIVNGTYQWSASLSRYTNGVYSLADVTAVSIDYFHAITNGNITYYGEENNAWSGAYNNAAASGANPGPTVSFPAPTFTTNNITKVVFTGAQPQSRNITNTFYLDANNGSDSLGRKGQPDMPFLTFTKVLSQLTAGDTIMLGRGAFAFTNTGTITLPDRVSILGLGHALSSITNSGIPDGNTVLEVGNQTVFNGFTINCHITMGITTLKTNLTINDIWESDLVDGINLIKWSDVTVSNCRFYSHNDTVFETYALASNSIPATFWNCDLVSEDAGIASGLIHNVFPVGTGNLIFNNCSMTSLNGNAQTYCVFTQGGTLGKVTLNNVTMYYSNTNGGPVAAAVSASGGVQIQGSYFDRVLNRTIKLDSSGSGKPANNIRTNFVSGQLYTNTYGSTIFVQTKAAVTVASVAGVANMCLEMLGNDTNVSGMNTIVGTIAQTYTNILSGVVTNNGTFTFTNRSSGAGNSSSLVGGQILIQ